MQYQTLLLFINFIIIFFLREREIYNIYIYNREERMKEKKKIKKSKNQKVARLGESVYGTPP
jgi:predicted membrane protein